MDLKQFYKKFICTKFSFPKIASVYKRWKSAAEWNGCIPWGKILLNKICVVNCSSWLVLNNWIQLWFWQTRTDSNAHKEQQDLFIYLFIFRRKARSRISLSPSLKLQYSFGDQCSGTSQLRRSIAAHWSTKPSLISGIFARTHTRGNTPADTAWCKKK